MAGPTEKQQIVTYLVLITLAITLDMARAAAINPEHLHRRLGCGTAGETTCGQGCTISSIMFVKKKNRYDHVASLQMLPRLVMKFMSLLDNICSLFGSICVYPYWGARWNRAVGGCRHAKHSIPHP